MNDPIAGMNKAAMQAMAAGDMKGAQSLFLQALAHDQANSSLWLNLSVVRRQLSDFDGAQEVSTCTT